MATKVGALLISLGLESGAFKSGLTDAQKELRKATKRFEAVGESMQSLGQKMSLAVTVPLVALGAASVKAAMESREAIGQVQQTITSMGNAAGRSVEQLQALASKQMFASLYDDDDILRKVSTTLLTFGKITGDTFDAAQQAAIDLSAKLGGDLQSSAIMIGKALNDPIKGITALTRAGVSFTEQQKDQIKAMTAAGNAAGAQKLILAELNKQFGGSAAASAKANPFAMFTHAMDDLKETIGGVLLPALTPLVERITDIVRAFGELSPGAQQTIVMFGAIAAVAGPVLTVFGSLVSAMAPFLGALSTIASGGGLLTAASAGFTGLAAVIAPLLPIIGAVAAVGAVIYTNWDRLVGVFEALGETFNATLGPSLTALISDVSATFTDLWQGPLGTFLKEVMLLLGDFAVVLTRVFGEVLIRTISAAVNLVRGAFDMFAGSIKIVSQLLTGDFSGAWETAKATVGKVLSAIGDALDSLVPGATAAMARLYEGVKSWVVDKLGQVWKWVTDKIDMVKNAFFNLYDAVVGHSYIPDMVDGIASHMARLDGVMVKPTEKATAKVTAAFRKQAEDVRSLLDQLFPEAAAKRSFDENFKTLMKAPDKLLPPQMKTAALDRLQTSYYNSKEQSDPAVIEGWDSLGVPPVDLGKVNEAVMTVNKAANDNAANIEIANVRVAKSFKDMADETIGAMRGLAEGIKGGDFFSILEGLTNLFMQLGSIGLFGNTISTRINAPRLPGRASGGTVSQWTPYMVGERGPEMFVPGASGRIVPNHALGGGGASKVEIVPGKYFDVRVDGRIISAAPGIMQGGAKVAMVQGAQRQSRRLG